jgi:hypothetical protein
MTPGEKKSFNWSINVPSKFLRGPEKKEERKKVVIESKGSSKKGGM